MTSMRRPGFVLLIAAAALLAGGCRTQRGTDLPGDAAGGAGAGAGGDAVATGDGSAASGSELGSAGGVGGGAGAGGPTEGLLARRIVYFEFDSSEVRNEDRTLIAAHAQYLAANPGTRVRLEGHTDERGTREYNIGLAERRSQSVRRALALEGVREDQATTVSYGEERPAAAGEDEAAYAQNRRVEIVYGN